MKRFFLALAVAILPLSAANANSWQLSVAMHAGDRTTASCIFTSQQLDGSSLPVNLPRCEILRPTNPLPDVKGTISGTVSARPRGDGTFTVNYNLDIEMMSIFQGTMQRAHVVGTKTIAQGGEVSLEQNLGSAEVSFAIEDVAAKAAAQKAKRDAMEKASSEQRSSTNWDLLYKDK
jgi:hypothetical protein